MKKILFAIAFVMTMSFCANAQSDGFFKSSGSEDNTRDAKFGLPGEHGLEGDQGAPLGEGLLILTAMGAGYAIMRRKK